MDDSKYGFFAFVRDGKVANLAMKEGVKGYILQDGQWVEDPDIGRNFMFGFDAGDGYYISDQNAAEILPYLLAGKDVPV